MNKKILAISILMLMVFAMTVSVFAEDNNEKEKEYTVTVQYQTLTTKGEPSGKFSSKTYTIWAFTAREAEQKAMELCKYDIENKKEGVVSSCGAANATGKTR